MKNILYLLLMFPLLVLGQTNTENYVKTSTYIEPVKDSNDNKAIVNVTYYDGLGRPIQQVQGRASTSGTDIITHIEYDNNNRQPKQYLPYKAQTSNFEFDPSAKANTMTFYNTVKYENTGNPYSEQFYEPSPLNRVLKQGAPGGAWKGDTIVNSINDHTVKFNYETNLYGEVRNFKVVFPNEQNTEKHELSCIGYYNANQLFKTITKDENWKPADGKCKTTEEFKDQLGRLILKRTYLKGENTDTTLDTYYVYDRYGNLTYVIPPLAADQIVVAENIFFEFDYKNYPWTRVVNVVKSVEDDYDLELAAYNNSEIINLDFMAKYGKSGGVSLSTDKSGGLSLNLNISTNVPVPFRTGDIIDLDELGYFQDKELGRITGSGYQYTFSISNNKINVVGFGNVPSIIKTFANTENTDFNKNFPWTALCNVDSKISERYDNDILNLNNSEILTTYTPNTNNAKGGMSFTMLNDDSFMLAMNIESDVSMELKSDVPLPLNLPRSIKDISLGTITGNGYNYEFYIKDNALFARGTGKINLIRTSFLWTMKYNYVVQENVKNLCYIYCYNSRNLVARKHIPDNGWTYINYDYRNRPISTQDENQRVVKGDAPRFYNIYSFTEYDKFDRVCYTGVYGSYPTNNNENPSVLSTVFNIINTEQEFENKGLKIKYSERYSNTASNVFEVFTVNYYDDYSLKPEGITLPSTVGGSNTLYTTNVKGLPVTSLVKALDAGEYPNNWIIKVPQYDDKGREIWSINKNTYLDTEDIISTTLDFTGKPLSVFREHKKNNANDLKIRNSYNYDKHGRLISDKQQINDNDLFDLIEFNRYDELGNLEQKKIGGKTIVPIFYEQMLNQLQTIDYKYNIRGWLKSINDPSALNNDLFAFGIKYNDHGHYSQFNGNIAQTHWISANDGVLKQYDYDYDALNRLKSASFSKNGTAVKYNEDNIQYDKNGNILKMARSGKKEVGENGLIDNLVYTYKENSNQLLKVRDLTNDIAGFKGSNAGASDDYSYDANGNMEKDLNKQIGLDEGSKIKYNHLNLPTLITKSNGDDVKYIYTATGEKLAKVATLNDSNATTTTTQYANGIVYKNNEFEYFSHSQGYVRKETNGKFTYVYQYKDHLGNVRLSYADANGDGVISGANFSEGFEDGVSNWGGIGSNIQLELDSTIFRSGKYSAKITSPGPDGRYSKCGVWMDINNSQDTYYTYTVYIKSNRPNAEIVLFLKTAEETGFYTSIDSYAYHGYMTQWTKLEKTVLVPANIKKLSLRLDTNADGTVWFDDVSIVRTDGALEIIEETDYYPFGLEHTKDSNIVVSSNLGQKIKYNGKELQDELGLGWYDYQARNYDPAIGRWFNIDPMAEKSRRFSPYAYALDNPVYFIDPDGMFANPGDFINEKGKKVGSDGKSDGKLYVIKTSKQGGVGGDFDSEVASAGITKSQAKETEKFIQANSGNTAAFESNSIAYTNSVEIEGNEATRQGMVNEVTKDNGKGGTSDSNNREFGGNVNNDGSVVPATPGGVGTPKDPGLTINMRADENTKTMFHDHSSGTLSESNGGATTNYSYRQAPSQPDIDGAKASGRTEYVFGLGNGTVYIYNGTGVIATVPQENFVKPK